MENLTHSLVGVACARGLFRHADVAAENRAVTAAVLASNLADLDSFAGLFGGKLVYLLQHRGYTHTLLAAPIIAAVSVGLATRARRGELSWRLFFIALCAALLHIAADAMNDYGVHPFWPLQNAWFYGGFVFISEPLLLSVLLPYAWRTARAPITRWLLGTVLALLLYLLWLTPIVTLASALVVTGLGGLFFFWPRRRPCWEALLLIVLVFAIGRRKATLETPTGESLIAASTTPAPANPFCWRVAASTIDGNDLYRVRVATLSLWPALVSPDTCDRLHRTHGMPEPTGERAPDRIWGRGFSAPLAALKERGATSCRFAAFMHYAELPFVTERSAGDLRYDTVDAPSFSSIDLAGDCPRVPPWVTPLQAWMQR